MKVADKLNAMLKGQKIEQGLNLADTLQKMQQDLAAYQQSQSASVIGTATTSIPHSFWSLPTQLSPDEEKELNTLELERISQEKIARLNAFKELPREFRQSVVNMFLWEEAVTEINATVLPDSDRLRDLKSKRAGTQFYGGGFSSFPMEWPPTDRMLGTSPLLPRGITKEDLLQAHMDASLEEELQREQPIII